MTANRFQLVPHSVNLAIDSSEKNRWMLAAYIAALDAGGQLNHRTHQAAVREGQRLDTDAGFRWWVIDTTGKTPATPASGWAI
jgi:hypothetical protein